MKSTFVLAITTAVLDLFAFGNDNGLALLPPMGWRSWNLFGANVNQQLIEGIMDAMVRRDRTVDGVPTSLCDLGCFRDTLCPIVIFRLAESFIVICCPS